MLRITVTTLADRTRLVLEGRLGGPWAAELASCWQTLLAAHDPRPIQVDLNGLTFIDAAGRKLLREMRDRGAMLAATELMTHAIGEEQG
jgi:anti-anti-sigma regulatory factor